MEHDLFRKPVSTFRDHAPSRVFEQGAVARRAGRCSRTPRDRQNACRAACAPGIPMRSWPRVVHLCIIGVRHVGMKLQREASAVAEGLHLEHVAFGQKLGAVRQDRNLRGATGRPAPATHRPRTSPAGGRPDRVIADLGLALRDAERPGRRARAHTSARQDKCRGRASSPCSGTEIQSISRRMKSSGSLALIGPPKMTAPACSASVSGSGSPNRGRRMSSGKPSWPQATWPTRPGVECSWCRMIRIGCGIARKESAPALWYRVRSQIQDGRRSGRGGARRRRRV